MEFIFAHAVYATHHEYCNDDMYCHMSFDAGCISAGESSQLTRIMMAGLLSEKAETSRQADCSIWAALIMSNERPKCSDIDELCGRLSPTMLMAAHCYGLH